MEKDRKIRNTSFRKCSGDFTEWVKQREQGDPHRVDMLWKEIERQSFGKAPIVLPKRSLKKRWLIAVSVAASLLLLLGSYFWTTVFSYQPDLTAELFNIYPSADSIKEIALITPNEQIHVEDNARLQYDKQGTLQVNRQSVRIEKQPEVKKLNHLVVPKGKRTQITFSDGTKMYVNAGSQVIYPSIFDKDKREIVVEGEVFLEVVHNTNWPFIVKTDKLDVKVLGTVFNVCAYKGDASTFVVLVDGSVEVGTAKNGKSLLTPNQIFNMGEKGISTENVDVSKYICWKDNQFLLKEDKIGDVLSRLSRYYGVGIECEKAVCDIAISGKLDLRNDVKEVINLVAQSAYLQCRQNEDGTYSVTEK